ncbi:SAM-dependent methyltransferase [Actinomadura scrupuli]|uniref:SAM-dependent methyltransferase n=1 Tax=Actinomadura scrupuli TaxID=559629 RepID=UPI003D987141
MSDPHEPTGQDGQISKARAYNALTGGDDNTSAERRRIAAFMKKWPSVPRLGAVQRAYVLRAVRYLAEEHGMDQFLELGCALPSSPNIHDVAQSIHPNAAVVYVDNDPSVLAHAEASYAAGPRTTYIEADVSKPDYILTHPSTRQLIDFSRPVAVLMFTVWHYVPDTADPAAKIAQYREAVPKGSIIAMSHEITDGAPQELVDDTRAVFPGGQFPRPLSEVEQMLAGLTIIEPWTDLQLWRAPEPEELAQIRLVGAIARKD